MRLKDDHCCVHNYAFKESILDGPMSNIDIATLDTLRRLHQDVATRLAKESEDYRLLVALRQTIAWLEKRESGTSRSEPAELLHPSSDAMPAIEILAALA